MGKPTLRDEIIRWLKSKELKFMNFLLKRNGYDFGVYYLEELEKMYQQNKDSLNLT